MCHCCRGIEGIASSGGAEPAGTSTEYSALHALKAASQRYSLTPVHSFADGSLRCIVVEESSPPDELQKGIMFSGVCPFA